jgi:L-ascorbate metabolism protein UlaG (beta-lactamase superfamily)
MKTPLPSWLLKTGVILCLAGWLWPCLAQQSPPATTAGQPASPPPGQPTEVLTGDRLVTDDGEVIIHPINHATLALAWKGKLIYVDPVGGPAPFQGLPRADLILVAHGHGDHFSAPTLEAVRKKTAVIIAPPSVFASMSGVQKALTVVLPNGAATNLLGLGIEAVPAYNRAAGFHRQGEGNGYVLTLGGRRIYLSGDTEDIPEMRALKTIDVAFVCMNRPYTMTVDQAASAVLQFRPKVVYPYHFRNSDGSMANLAAFQRQVETVPGVEVRLRKWY